MAAASKVNSAKIFSISACTAGSSGRPGRKQSSAKLAKAWPCVLAGDFNQSTPKLSSWIRATRRVDTLDKAGTQPIDAAFIRGKIGAGESTVVDPGALSDHKWLGVKLILGGSTL